jgi:hypothetical protein
MSWSTNECWTVAWWDMATRKTERGGRHDSVGKDKMGAERVETRAQARVGLDLPSTISIKTY